MSTVILLYGWQGSSSPLTWKKVTAYLVWKGKLGVFMLDFTGVKVDENGLIRDLNIL